MSFIDKLADTSAARSKSGELMSPGKGRVIVKDLAMFKGFDDPQTFKMELVVKSSHPVANEDNKPPDAPGSTVVVIEKLGGLGADSRVVSILEAVLGEAIAPEGSAERKAQFKGLLRTDDAGYTKNGSPCPAFGRELSYDCPRVVTKKNFVIYPPKFASVPFDEVAEAANRKAISGE